MPYLYSELSTLQTLPWVYIDEGENRVYLLNFRKIDDNIEHSIYEDYYTYGSLENLYTDTQANTYLNNIDTIKSTIFTSNLVQEILSDKVFQGEQISATAGTANALYQLIEGVYYQFDSNNSLNADGSKGLQMVRMVGNARGRLSLPIPFIFDKFKNLEPVNYDFSVFPIIYIATGLDNSGIVNSEVVLSYNPVHGFYCNKSLTPTANIHQSLIDFLPSISLSADPAHAWTDSTTTANIVANVVYANNDPYPSAQTSLFLTTTAGFINPGTVPANSSGNAVLLGMGTPDTATIIVTAGWSNYKNVANLNLSVMVPTPEEANTPEPYVPPPSYLSYPFTEPGTYTFAVTPFTKMKVKLWGGGGGGGDTSDGTDGTASSFTPGFGTPAVAGGGHKGTRSIGLSETPGINGAGGTATGGNTMVNGTGLTAPGPGGGGSGRPGWQYGGAGLFGSGDAFSYSVTGGSGGVGAYCERTYENNEISGNVTVVVGAGGTGGAQISSGGSPFLSGNGAGGAVIVEWIV